MIEQKKTITVIATKYTYATLAFSRKKNTGIFFYRIKEKFKKANVIFWIYHINHLIDAVLLHNVRYVTKQLLPLPQINFNVCTVILFQNDFDICKILLCSSLCIFPSLPFSPFYYHASDNFYIFLSVYYFVPHRKWFKVFNTPLVC